MKSAKTKLPRFASWTIQNLLPDYLGHTAIGDYEEVYARTVEQGGVFKAHIWLWRQIFISIFLSLYWGVVMLKNYVKVAFRNMHRHKGFSFINIAGLAVGMACAMLIFLWVQDELSYDRFHKDAEDIYRVAREVHQPGHTFHTTHTSAELCRVIRDEFPEIVAATAINGRPRVLFKHGDKAFYEEGLVQVDASFFEILSFPLIAGDPQTALSEENAIVITEDIATKYFGDDDPLDKNLTWNNWVDRRVTGVIKNIPQNSHIRFDMVINTESMRNSWPAGLQWEWKIFRTYVKLQKGAEPEQFGHKVTETIDNKYPHHSQFQERIYLQPLTQAHLHAVEGGSSIKYVYIFSLIALFVLFIACINYMNLATARSATRAKELDFDKENIVYIPMKENIGKNYQAIKIRLLQNPNIVSVAAKDRLPTRSYDIGMIDWEGKDVEQNLEVEFPWIDYEYFETLNMEIVDGRNFSRTFSSDIKEAVIVNEEALKRMNLKLPLGKRITFQSGTDYFSILAILISFLGLFGLASFMAERRTKEIGVRKVLGASGGHIMRLLSGEFVKWIIVANLIAWPAAYLALQAWLKNYAYRIKMEWWVFLISGMLALAIAFLTVSYQAIKAARSDPVKALRYQ